MKFVTLALFLLCSAFSDVKTGCSNLSSSWQRFGLVVCMALILLASELISCLLPSP